MCLWEAGLFRSFWFYGDVVVSRETQGGGLFLLLGLVVVGLRGWDRVALVVG